jgi:hypothetical protein
MLSLSIYIASKVLYQLDVNDVTLINIISLSGQVKLSIRLVSGPMVLHHVFAVAF